MIKFKEFTLDNGLRVIVNPIENCNVATVNVMYNVGSKNENENKTGLAHFFEHLMFGGSKNATNYDAAIHKSGGTNNAYTTQDITNYYCTIPACNIETAFWLESDRMLELLFEQSTFKIQKQVVIEEFKESYLNKPYGDLWLKICNLSYEKHNYKWPTIGKSIEEIQSISIDDVKEFYHKFYCPNNAVLGVSGGVTIKQIQKLSKKWFEPIPARKLPNQIFAIEPIQAKSKKLTIKSNVPLNAIYKSFPAWGLGSKEYYICELINNILSNGKSSRLQNKLINEKKYFVNIDSSMSDNFDPGLLILGGKLNENTTFAEAEYEIDKIITNLQSSLVSKEEITKSKNQTIANIDMEIIDMMNVIQNLSIGCLLNDTDLINKEKLIINKITSEEIKNTASNLFKKNNCNTIYYEKNF